MLQLLSKQPGYHRPQAAAPPALPWAQQGQMQPQHAGWNEQPAQQYQQPQYQPQQAQQAWQPPSQVTLCSCACTPGREEQLMGLRVPCSEGKVPVLKRPNEAASIPKCSALL